MSAHVTDTDLSALFGIEFDARAEQSTLDVTAVLCSKCKGLGNFIGYTGRVVGKCFACDSSGLARATCSRATAADVSAIAKAFAAARDNGIKRPRLRLDTFTFSRAPDTGRNVGAIYVKTTESGEYLGKVTGGQFHPTRECDDPTRARVVTVAADPHSAAKAFGQRTGECSCCGRELTNGLSIDLGIGPICRGRFGW